jgi:hypothetical protein
MNKKGAIYMIALGSVIVIAGVIMYMMEFLGATGMIILGFFTELAGVYFYRQNRNKK